MQGCASPRQMLLSGVADALAAQGRADEDDLLFLQVHQMQLLPQIYKY